MIGRRHIGLIAVAAALAIAGCGIGAAQSPRTTFAPTPGPDTALSPAIAQTRAGIVAALGSVNLILDDPRVPFRPAESPTLSRAPRTVFQAVLPDDPAHGFISVYEFPTLPDAEAAAEEQAAYVTSGPGRVQFPPDAQFIIRRVGTTVVFHVFSRGSSGDPRGADVAVALQSLGDPIAIPR